MKYLGIDPITLQNLMAGWFTCYWCGGLEDKDHIGDHVDNCLREVNWLRQHVEHASDPR